VESDADEDFVRQLAFSLDVPISVERIEVRILPGNLEENARNARLASFRKLVATGEVDRVATGHTASDQAETVLFRLLRGASTTGLSGIQPVTQMGLIRPLLDVSRDEVRVWLRSRQLEWREDATNSDLTLARNRIRNCLIPQLEREFNPRIGFVLSTTAALARDDEEYWASEIGRLSSEIFDIREDTIVVQLGSFCRPTAVCRRLIREAIRLVKGDLRSIDFSHVDQVVGLMTKPEGHGIVKVPGATVTRSFDWVRFSGPCPTISALPIRLKLEEIMPSGGTMKGEGLDADKLPGDIQGRSWSPGDRFRGRKMKHWFHDHRIPVWDRSNWPVFASGSRVIWTRKFGADEQFAATSESRRLLFVSEA